MFQTKLVVLAVVSFILSFVGSVAAQVIEPPEIEWEKTFGGANNDWGQSVQQTIDGGYIIAGSSSYHIFFGSELSDVYLIKIDARGNNVWEKTIGGEGYDLGYSVQQTTDGGYIIAGTTHSFDDGVYLVKTDFSGNMVWQKTFGGTIYSIGFSVKQTTDGGYIVAGRSVSAGNHGVYLVKTDFSGNMVWQKTFGGENIDEGRSVQQTTDGGYIVAGVTISFGAGSSDVYLVKTDFSGNMVWEKTFGGEGEDRCLSAQQTIDGGYIVAGSTTSFGAGNNDVYLIKTDSSGNLVWQKTFGGEGRDDGYSVQQISDGGYIVAGGSESSVSNYDVCLIKTDSLGNLVWQKTFGGEGYDLGYSVQQTSDGGYIIAGTTHPFGAGSRNAYLIKLKPENTVADCNKNGINDATDISSGTSKDCNINQIPDECDIASAKSKDVNSNEIPDECEQLDTMDSDGDGLSDAEEARLGTDPQNPDTDQDGIFDGFEAMYPGCLDPLEKYDAGFDCDLDNSPNQEEFYYGTDPTKADSLPVWAPEDVYGTPLNGGVFLKWKGPKSAAVKGFTVHLEPVGEGGSGGEILDFPVSANENYILITGLNPGSSYRGQVYTWDFAGKKYPSPPDGFYVTSTSSILPLPTPILKHPIIFVPGAGATPNSQRFQEMKIYLKGLGLLYGGNYWYDRSKKPPVVHSEVNPEGSFYDITFSVSAGNPTENGRELGEMIQAINDGRVEKTNKVILICHSLGGISARCYLQNTNVFKNNVEKFITIGTPHLGVFPDNANYRNRNIVGVDRMILEAYYPEIDRYSCAPCPWFYAPCTFDTIREKWKIIAGQSYVKEVIRALKNGGWDFTKDALAKDLLFSGSQFMNGLNKPTENGVFTKLPKNVEYWSFIGRDKGDFRHLFPPLYAGFMNTFLRNCATNETCQPGCANSNAGDGFISAWSQNLSNSQAALGTKITPKEIFGVNHEEESQEVESFLQAIGSQPVVFTSHSPVHIEVSDPEGRITSRYRWEIPGAFAREEDIDDDEETEESISIFLPQAGEYEVKAVPKPDAPPDATYSITVEMNGKITELVKNRSISEIPVESEKVFVNTRPVAVVKGPELIFVQLGEQAQVRLDGSSSYDIDSDPLTYRWVWDQGSSSEISLLFDLNAGTYKFQLTVNDGFNDSETKEFFVRVVSIIRGDANWDGTRDISDAIAILGCLFLGTKCPTDSCTLDVNSDGTGDISDAVYLLSFLFLGGPAPKSCITP